MHFLARFTPTAAAIEIIQQASAINTAGATTYNHSCNIGTAEAGRRVIVGCMSRKASGAAFTIESLTVNGVSATQRVTMPSPGTDYMRAAIWIADVPSGSGAVTVSVTHSGAIDESAVYTVATRNQSSGVPTFTGTNTLDNNNDASIASVTAQAGGITFGVAACDNATATFTWTNLTEVYDTSPAGMGATAALDLQASAFSATVTVNGTNTGTAPTGAMVVASFR